MISFLFRILCKQIGATNCWIQVVTDLKQVWDGISRINDVDLRLVSRPACELYSAVVPKIYIEIMKIGKLLWL